MLDCITAYRRRARSLAAAALAALVMIGTCVGVSEPASAASTLNQVTGFGSNPGNLGMYVYLPTNLPAGAPLVVALHGCTQSASDYYSNAGWPKYADLWGFAVVFPQTTSANNSLSCFNWFDPTKDARGVGEALSIKQMIDYAVAHYGVNTHRIYITGLSAGGAMTADMLADYPDVFAGGATDSGLPASCATTQTQATQCQYSNQNKTPAQWGNLARADDSGYSGPWPRVAIWQGSADTEVEPVNSTELRDQWTNVWGISQTASSTHSLTGGTTENVYNDASGQPAVELYTISGMAHGTAVNPGSAIDQCGTTGTYYPNYICSTYYTAEFFGLNQTSGGSLPAPTGLAVTSTTNSSIALSWSAVSGAASYDVYRNGALAGTTSATAFTDTGLTASTSYSYTVAAVDSTGTSGSLSSPVTGTTTGTSGGGLSAPTGLAVTGTTSSTVSLSWTAVTGAASYHVYRNGGLSGTATGTTYTDTGLAASTSYTYTVAAVSSGGAEGTASAPVTGTTATPPVCYTANNYSQTVAGRAYVSGGYTYANGSNQNMGLWNVFVTHTLKQTGPNYYVIADSGC